MIRTEDETCEYDALGRRVQKGSISYLYIGDEEIGSFENQEAKELKIMGSKGPVAIEIDSRPYFPVTDTQGTIRYLIDPDTKTVCRQNNCDAFGAGITAEIPYAYAGKRYDAKTGLLYFGQRYYDPELGRWLSPDPMGSMDHSNLYQYVYNNPFSFQDPTGENVLGFLCGIGQILLGGVIMASGAGFELATCGGYTFVKTPFV